MYRSLLHVDTCSLHEKDAEGSVLVFVIIAMPNNLSYSDSQNCKILNL